MRINLLKKIFGKSEATETKQPENTSHFSIEFYPLTNRYYPKYKQNYLKKNTYTGIIQEFKPYLFTYADYGNTEQEADVIILKFKEQRLKENVITIKK